MQEHARDALHPTDAASLVVPAPYRLARIFRMLAAGFFVVFLGLAVSAIGLFFMLRGETVENSALTGKLTASVQKALGPNVLVELGTTSIGFDLNGLVSVQSRDVKLVRSSDRNEIAKLGQIVVAVRPMSLLSGNPVVDSVSVDNATLDARLLPAALGRPPSVDIAGELFVIGKRLRETAADFNTGQFRQLHLSNTTISGFAAGRRDASDMVLKSLDLRALPGRPVALDFDLKTAVSQVSVSATWKNLPGGGNALLATINGVSASEWASDPRQITGPVGSDALVDMALELPFASDGTALPATALLKTGKSLLRLGEEAASDLNEGTLKLVVDPSTNELRLAPSGFSAGLFSASVAGFVRPAPGRDWIKGPLVLELSASEMTRTPTQPDEPQIKGEIIAAGSYDIAAKKLEFETIRFAADEDILNASAIFAFVGLTPAITGKAQSNGIEIAALKQFWPMFLAPSARNWAFRNIVGGRVTDISVEAGIPAGIIGRFRKGARMAPEDFSLRAGFEGVSISAFGDLPPIAGAKGRYSMLGMEVNASFEKGTAQMTGFDPVALKSGSFRIADIGARPNQGELAVAASGPARGLAAIADAKPLLVLSRIDLSPQTVSGEAHLDLVSKFPLVRELSYGDVDWNAIIELKKAASKQKVLERTVRDADLVIEANPVQVRIKGDATVDGTRTRLSMVEPIGGSNVARERSVSAELDEAARKKMGLVLDPVVSGPIKVDLKQFRDGAEKQTVVLDDALLSLPWVGWTKGKGIPAKATFSMKTDKGITKLDEFYIEGTGFTASGSLILDKSGLKQADFVDISLNDGDSFSLKLERVAKTSYKIVVSGLRYDARSLINRLFHETGFGQEQGDSTVTVTANLGEVRGFNGRSLGNVEMSYGAKGGWLNNLSLRGSFSDNTFLNVHAVTLEGQTTFDVDSTDAGGALAFSAVYPKMKGGKLRASLSRKSGGPFVGPVRATDFVVENEPRIKSLVSEPATGPQGGMTPDELRDELRRIDTNRVRFSEARGSIEKGEGYFRVNDGSISNAQIGFTFDGLVYDQKNRMELSGTFLPAIGLSRAIGYIPLVGEILGNGRESGLIGVTYRLKGSARNPEIEINPVSVVAPGIFRKVFEFQK